MKTLSEKISAIKAFCFGAECDNCPLYHYSDAFCYYDEIECAAIASHKSEIIITCLNVDCNFLSTDYEDLRQEIIDQINSGMSEMISFYDMI